MAENKLNLVIPLSDDYIRLAGMALYCYSYYETFIVSVIAQIDREFWYKYFREWALSSGQLKNKFKRIKDENPQIINLDLVYFQFELIIDRRNRLVHAHPITDENEGQILYYQADVNKSVSDFKWTIGELERFTNDVNQLTSDVSRLRETIE